MHHASCRGLEQHFQGCSRDLDTIAQTLEANFENKTQYRRVRHFFHKASAAHLQCRRLCTRLTHTHLQNPAEMLRRLKVLRDDLPRVQEDWRRIMIAKQDLIEVCTYHTTQTNTHDALGLVTGNTMQLGARSHEVQRFQYASLQRHNRVIHKRHSQTNTQLDEYTPYNALHIQ